MTLLLDVAVLADDADRAAALMSDLNVHEVLSPASLRPDPTGRQRNNQVRRFQTI
jgi:hypothetical protein